MGDRRNRALNELVRRSIDESAPRLGVDRRRFLQGAVAVAASLAAFELAGCSSATTRGGQRGPATDGAGRRWQTQCHPVH